MPFHELLQEHLYRHQFHCCLRLHFHSGLLLYITSKVLQLIHLLCLILLVASNQLKKKLERLQKLEQEIKDQEKKVEQDVGKAFLKAFNIPHEESDRANELIEELLMLYKEANLKFLKSF